MNGEFLGIGRTWWFALVGFIVTSILFGTDKLTADQWMQMSGVFFGGGTLKSTVQKLTEKKG